MLERATAFFDQVVYGTMEITDLMEESATNAFPAPDAEVRVPTHGGALYPTSDIRYDGFYLSLEPGQRLVLEGVIADALYSSIVYYDDYFATPDDPRCWLNDADLLARFPERRYTVTVAPDDPADGTVWLSTAGGLQGIVALRYLCATNATLPTIEVRGDRLESGVRTPP